MTLMLLLNAMKLFIFFLTPGIGRKMYLLHYVSIVRTNTVLDHMLTYRNSDINKVTTL
jgi:hypothetical protein